MGLKYYRHLLPITIIQLQIIHYYNQVNKKTLLRLSKRLLMILHPSPPFLLGLVLNKKDLLLKKFKMDLLIIQLIEMRIIITWYRNEKR
jgi:hypothetical protein